MSFEYKTTELSKVLCHPAVERLPPAQGVTLGPGIESHIGLPAGSLPLKKKKRISLSRDHFEAGLNEMHKFVGTVTKCSSTGTERCDRFNKVQVY